MASPSKPPAESSDQAKELAGTLPLLRLRLDKDDSFMNQVRTALSQKSKPFRTQALVNYPQSNLGEREKLKPPHAPATLIRIGSWQFASEHEPDLVGKFYFASRKLVWEVLANGLKKKMEIHWRNISAIRATIEENKPGILEIELHWPPSFYRETDPQPQCPSFWIKTEDFTAGQALICPHFIYLVRCIGHILQRHYLEFPSAALERNYIKLLSSDCRLLELSQSSFPSSAETTFCTLQQSGSENSQMTQESNNLSQLEALPHPCPAAAADSALHLRDHSNSPHVGVTGAPTLQSPAIMRNTQWHFVFDPNPISRYHPRLPPAITSTFTSLIGSSSAVGSAINDDAMGVQQEHDGYANNRGKFIGPSEKTETFTSLIGLSSAVGSASNDDAMGVQQEHDGYANNGGKFISPSEQNETHTSSIVSSSAGAYGSNGESVMQWVRQKHDGC